MRAAAHEIGRSHQDPNAGCMQRLRRFDRSRKLGERHTVADRFRDVIGGGVVVARQRYVVRAGEADEVAVVRLGMRGLVGDALANSTSSSASVMPPFLPR